MTLILDPEKFSELPAAGPLTGPEIIPIVQGGVNKQTTVDDLPIGTGVVESVVAGTNVTVDDTDPANPIVSATSSGGGAVDSVNSQTGDVVLDQDDIGDGTTYKQYSQADKSKLAGIEAGAEVNNISDANATDLTDGNDTTLHKHDDRYYTETEINTLLTGKQNADADLDVWATKTAPTGTVVGASDSQTLTNKRINQRVTSVAGTGGTQTPNCDIQDQFQVTAMSVDTVFAVPTGTPVNAQLLTIRLTDNGSARLLTWNSIYRPVGAPLPTTTVAGKTAYLLFRYNNTDSKWDLIVYSIQDDNNLKSSVIDTDGTLAGNSDSRLASQKAVKTYADTKQSALGYTAEDVANKDTDGTLAANSDTKYASQKATKTYADTKVAATTLAASGKGSVVHGSVAGTPRPTGYLSIEWIGDVEPTNATNDDTWVDTSS